MAKKGTLTVRIIGDHKPLDRSLDSIGGKIKKGLGTLAKWGAAAAAAGAAAATAFGVDAVRAATDLNETLSKTQQVFGNATDRVTSFADRMANAFGLPKQEILDAASNIGLVAKASGFGEEAAAGMSTQMAQLAADASSFFNVPLPDALEKIRAGLVGEAEPLRAFGVLLSAAAVEEKAVAAGIAEVGQELSEQQKVMARAMIIQEQMGDASGDLERTQDSLANKVRALKGRFENFKTEIGQQLLPIAEKLVGWVETSALPAFQRLTGWVADRAIPAFQVLSAWFQREVTPRLMDFADAVRDNWPTVERIFEDLGRVVEAVGQIISDSFKDWRNESDDTATTIKSDFGTVISAAAGLVGALADASEGFSRFLGASHKVRIGIYDNVIRPIRDFINVDLYPVGKNLILGLLRGIRDMVPAVIRAADDVGQSMMDAFKRRLGISSPSKVFFEFGTNTIQGYIDGIEGEAPTLDAAMRDIFDQAIGGVGDIIGGIDAIRGRMDAQGQVDEAAAELARLMQRQQDLPALISDAREILADSIADATEVTKEEELRILRAKQDVERAEKDLQDAREDGTKTADELRILELELAEAEARLSDEKQKAKGWTDAVRNAEQNLKDLRSEQKTISQQVKEAENALTEAKLRAVRAEQQLAQAGRALLDQGPAATELFRQLAQRAGLGADEIGRMVEKTEGLKVKITSFGDDGASFEQQLARLAEKAAEVGSSAGGAGGKVDDLGDAIGGIPDEILSTFFADTEDAMSDIKRLQDEMRRLNNLGFNVAIPGTTSGGLVMHSGGVVPGRPGQEVPAILEAGEMVIPADATFGGGGVHVTVNAPNFYGSADELASAVADALVRRRRAGGPALTGAI